MSATTSQNITIRNDNLSDIAVMRGALVSAGIVYHGCYVFLDYDGYWKNAVSTIGGIKAVGIVKSMYLEDQTVAGKTEGIMTATANGSLTANTNCVDIYVKGEFEGTFDSVGKINEGSIAYVYDNNTLTIDASKGVYPIGRVTKYKSSTVASVLIDGFKVDNGTKIIRKTFSGQTATTTEPFVYVSMANPYGTQAHTIVDILVGISATGTTTNLGKAGIAPTSSNALAAGYLLISSSGFGYGDKGIHGLNDDRVTRTTLITADDGHAPMTWTSDYYFALEASSSGTTGLAGWVELYVRKI